MALARWQATIVDEEGNIVPNASIEVRREISGSPAAILFSDRDGSVPLGNPFSADSEGFVFFHVAGGAFKITATAPGFQRIWRYVGIGTNSEGDSAVGFTPSGAWNASASYDIGDVVSHRQDDSVFAFVSNIDENLANEPQFGSDDIGVSDEFWTCLGTFTEVSEGGGEGSITIYDESTGTNTILASEMANSSLHIFKAGVTNTGAATYNGRPFLNAAGGALRAGEVQAGTWYIVVDDNTNYYLVASGAVR